MSDTYVNIELINSADIEMAHRKIIGENEVKRINVNALIEDGAHMMYINEGIKETLGLSLKEKREGRLEDGSIFGHHVVGPIEIRYNGRRCTVGAIVFKNLPTCSISSTTFDLLIKDVLRI